MFDIKWIRENPKEFDKGLGKRGMSPLAQELIYLDEERRQIIAQTQELQNKRNLISKQIGLAKQKGEMADTLMEEANKIREELPQLEERERILDDNLKGRLAYLPNIPGDDVPMGKDEHDNLEVRTWGTKPTFDFEPRQHFDIGEALGQMDFEMAARTSGARFVFLRSDLARLERALINFMLDTHTRENGYEEFSTPYLVKDEAMFGVGQLPKFMDDAFCTTNNYWLIPTAEVPLTASVMGQILESDALPLRMTAHTPCFRSEAGSAGKDTRGMIRQHQFHKVELVSVTRPEESEAEHQRMLNCAQGILEKLGLPYRTVVLCTGDMGFGSRKTFDIEVWLPGQNMYREISSCSNCGDFQARRMNARFRTEDDQGKKRNEFVHTLNGSGLAVGRTLVAILENYQQADGSVRLPDALHPHMHGQTVIQSL